MEGNKSSEEQGGEEERSEGVCGMDVAAHAASGALRIPLLVGLFSPSPSTVCLLSGDRLQHWCVYTLFHFCIFQTVSAFCSEEEATLLKGHNGHNNPALKLCPNVPENALSGMLSVIVIMHFNV